MQLHSDFILSILQATNLRKFTSPGKLAAGGPSVMGQVTPELMFS
jgi:hypothetical protein